MTQRKKRLKPAVGYVRMSKDTQSDSPERQRQEIEALAARDGYRILRWYEDHGKTGTKSKNRLGFQQMLSDAAAKGDFCAVLMYEQSRFSRENFLDTAAHWKRLKDAGVKQVTVQKGEISFDTVGGAVTGLLGQIEAEGESINIAKRTLSGKLAKARRGIRFGQAPFGYDREVLDESGTVLKQVHFRERFQKAPGWTTRLVPSADTEAVDAVRYAYEQFAAGVSRRRIAVELNRRGVTNSQGEPMSSCTVDAILRNPVYMGVFRFGHVEAGEYATTRDELIYKENAHPAIVPRSLFNLVQQVIEATKRSRGVTDAGRYLLSGIVRCMECGEPMYGAWRVDETYPTGLMLYRCQTGHDGVRECKSRPYINGNHLERMVVNLVATHILCDANHQHLIDAARRMAVQEDAPAVEETQLLEVRRKIQRATENLAEADDAEEYAAVSRVRKQWI
ncbi:MAG: recombinase family protein, partial [Planctomycetaceae bacterium]|nr:recombinase family protein [Planctomycetaceae bacterium]